MQATAGNLELPASATTIYLLLNISNSNRLLWVKFPHFAKPQNVMRNGPKEPQVRGSG